MPELPEVETIRAGLVRLLTGRVVENVTVLDSPKSFPNSQDQVDQFLIGSRVIGVRRRAKVLLIDLDTDYSLVIHLKMTGQMVFRGGAGEAVTASPSSSPHILLGAHSSHEVPLGTSFERSAEISLRSISQSPHRSVGSAEASAAPSQPPSSSTPQGASSSGLTRGPNDEAINSFAGGHPNDSLIGQLPDRSTRVEMTLSDGAYLFFNDQRKFGWVKLLPTAEVDSLPFFQKVGPEPLDSATKPEDFIQRIRRRSNSMIKPAILDQSVIAGIGNIYADEALWAAKIHPETRVRYVTDEQLNTLFNEVRNILNLSIEKGGSTDRNYIDAEGRRGSYLSFANVFRREGQPCHRHPDQEIIKFKVAGRGTHICPVCQEKPEA